MVVNWLIYIVKNSATAVSERIRDLGLRLKIDEKHGFLQHKSNIYCEQTKMLIYFCHITHIRRICKNGMLFTLCFHNILVVNFFHQLWILRLVRHIRLVPTKAVFLICFKSQTYSRRNIKTIIVEFRLKLAYILFY